MKRVLVVCIFVIAMLVSGCSSVQSSVTSSNEDVNGQEVTGKRGVLAVSLIDNEEQVILDSDDMKVIIKPLQYEESTVETVELDIVVENKTSEDVFFSADEVSINNVVISPLISTFDIGAGETVNGRVRFLESEIELTEIGMIKEIEIRI